MFHVVTAASLSQISNACACMLRAPPHAGSSSLRRTLSGILQVFAKSSVGDAHAAAIVFFFSQLHPQESRDAIATMAAM